MTNEVKEGIIGTVAGVGGAFAYWTKVVGDVGSAAASVLGAMTAAVVLWRLINNSSKIDK